MKKGKVTGRDRMGRAIKRPEKYCTTTTDEDEVLRRVSRQENRTVKSRIQKMMATTNMDLVEKLTNSSKVSETVSPRARLEPLHTLRSNYEKSSQHSTKKKKKALLW